MEVLVLLKGESRGDVGAILWYKEKRLPIDRAVLAHSAHKGLFVIADSKVLGPDRRIVVVSVVWDLHFQPVSLGRIILPVGSPWVVVVVRRGLPIIVDRECVHGWVIDESSERCMSRSIVWGGAMDDRSGWSSVSRRC